MNVLQHINLSRAPRLPLVLASEVSECGLACIAMIARFHGHDIDLNGLRQRFALSLSGMSLRSLMGLADQLGALNSPAAGRALRSVQDQDAGDPALGPQSLRRAAFGHLPLYRDP